MAETITKAQRRVLKRAGYSSDRKSAAKMTIKKGDLVVVRVGADSGRQGHVLQVLRNENRLIVENVAMVTRHQRRRPGVLQSETIEKPAAIHRSKVMLICPDCEKPTRIGHSTLPGGQKVRVCQNCNATVDKE